MLFLFDFVMTYLFASTLERAVIRRKVRGSVPKEGRKEDYAPLLGEGPIE